MPRRYRPARAFSYTRRANGRASTLLRHGALSSRDFRKSGRYGLAILPPALSLNGPANRTRSERAPDPRRPETLATTVEQTVGSLVTHEAGSCVLPPRTATPVTKARRVRGQPWASCRTGAARTDLSCTVAGSAVAFDVAADARDEPALGLPRVVLPRPRGSGPDRGRRVEPCLPGQRCDGRALRDAGPLVTWHAEGL